MGIYFNFAWLLNISETVDLLDFHTQPHSMVYREWSEKEKISSELSINASLTHCKQVMQKTIPDLEHDGQQEREHGREHTSSTQKGQAGVKPGNFFLQGNSDKYITNI